MRQAARATARQRVSLSAVFALRAVLSIPRRASND